MINLRPPGKRSSTSGSATTVAFADVTGKLWQGRSAIPNAVVTAFVGGVAQADKINADTRGFFTYAFAQKPATGAEVRFEAAGVIPVTGGLSAPDPLTITGTVGLAAAGVPFVFTPVVTGGLGNKSFILRGSLPPGLSFSAATGAISGTVAADGPIVEFSITVSDSSGLATLANLKLVTNSSRVPELTRQVNGLAAVAAPQAMYDLQASEGIDPEMHPHMGAMTHTAVKDGLWSDPTIWAGGVVPGSAADTIFDRATVNVNVSRYTVTYDLFMSDEKNANAKLAKALNGIHVSGSGLFKLSTAVESRLYVDTIMVHGQTSFGTWDDFIPESATLGKAFAEIVYLPQEAPGTSTRLGFMSMGALRMHGAPKADRLTSPGSIPVGSTVIPITGLAGSNWRKGDKVLLIATDYVGSLPTDPQYRGPTQMWGQPGPRMHYSTEWGFMQSHDEFVTLVDVSATHITIDKATKYPHQRIERDLKRGQHVDIKPFIANLSRSLVMRSAEASEGGDLTELQKRAHSMFMHSDDVDCRNVEFRNMARSDMNPTLATDQRPYDTTTNLTQYFVLLTNSPANGGVLMIDPLNVRGRYAVHLHGNGPYLSRRQCILQNLSIWAPPEAPPIPGWACTQHNARAAIERCVIANVRGAGMVTENGNEIGQWINNTVAWCRGDGYEPTTYGRAEKIQNHNGHGGTAYECQSRNILSQGNIASSSHQAWFFMQQATFASLTNPSSITRRIPDEFSLRYRDPLTGGFGYPSYIDDDVDYAVANGTYGVEQSQIPFFQDNISFGCDRAFQVQHRPAVDRDDTTPLIALRNHCIACRNAFAVPEYSWMYSFGDALWIGTGKDQPESKGYAAHFGSNTWQMCFVNIHAEDFPVVFYEDLGGFNYNGMFVDITYANCGRFAKPPIYTFTTDPALHIARHAMGTWVETSNGNGTWTVQTENWRSLDSATELPLDLKGTNLPIPPLGPPAVEPEPGRQRPYFKIDASSDLTVPPTGLGTITLSGVVVEGGGIRRWPDHYTFKEQAQTPATLPHKNIGMTGIRLVKRNGCFLDNGVWKTPLWFYEQNRPALKLFPFRIDLTLENFTGTIDGMPAADFLAKYTVDPTVHLEGPLLPETVTDTPAPLSRPTTAPIIVTGNVSTPENAALSQRLQAYGDGHVTWTVDTDTVTPGNEDGALFSIASLRLKWAGAFLPNFEDHQDKNKDGIYNVRLKCTDAWGNARFKEITVTVTDVLEAVTSYVLDFTGDNGKALSTFTGMTLVAGVECLFVTNNAIGAANPIPPVAQPSAYTAPDFGSSDIYVEFKPAGSAGNAVMVARYVDLNNWVGLLLVSVSGVQKLQLVQRLGSDFTHVLAEYGAISGNYASQTLRLEVQGNSARAYRNGVRLTPATGSEYLPAESLRSNRTGFVILSTSTAVGFDNFLAGALVIANAPASVAGNAIPQAFPWTGQVIHTTAVAEGFPEVALDFQWQQESAGVWADITGAKSRTYTVGAATADNRLRCAVTPAGGVTTYSLPTNAVAARKIITASEPFRDSLSEDGLLGYRNGWVVPDDAQKGAWRVVGAKIAVPQTGATLARPIKIEGPDIGQGNGYVQGILTNAGNHWMIMRYDPTLRTFLALRRNTGGQPQVFYQPESGAITSFGTPGTGPAIVAGDGDVTLRMEFKDGYIRVLYNGVEKIAPFQVASGVLAKLPGTRTGLINTPTIGVLPPWLSMFEAGRL